MPKICLRSFTNKHVKYISFLVKHLQSWFLKYFKTHIVYISVLPVCLASVGISLHVSWWNSVKLSFLLNVYDIAANVWVHVHPHACAQYKWTRFTKMLWALNLDLYLTQRNPPIQHTDFNCWFHHHNIKQVIICDEALSCLNHIPLSNCVYSLSFSHSFNLWVDW